MTLRQDIRELVERILPFDLLEKEHLDFVKNWIDSGAEIFRDRSPDVHLVSYFVLVDPAWNEFLLVDHKKAGLWLPPGGHVELDEHPKKTVRREIKEELGIESEFAFDDPQFVTVTKTVGNAPSHTDVTLWYVLKGDREQDLSFDRSEFHQIRWFNPDQIPYERSEPHLKRFILKSFSSNSQGLSFRGGDFSLAQENRC